MVSIAVTDRVKSDFDHDSVAAGAWVAARTGLQPLVHWAGKDRTPRQLSESITSLQAAGLKNLLVITGDRVERDTGNRQIEYMDSVNAIVQVRTSYPEAHIAAVVSSFKYREEELLNQYIKLVKKVGAGCELIISQIGWDIEKHRELIEFARGRNIGVPIMAAVFSPSPKTAKWINAGNVPGVRVTSDLLQLIEEEAAAADGGASARLRRLALQIVGLELLGYAGAQVTGIHKGEMATALMDLVDELRPTFKDYASWTEAWQDSLRLADGRIAAVAPENGFQFQSARRAIATPATQGKFRLLDAVDKLMFEEHSLGAPLLRVLSENRNSTVEKGMVALELAIKQPLVGCRSCGFCRLPYTQYVCPETCPKGLANGPCGGTNDNRCEFEDRECIHNQRYRLSLRHGSIDEMEQTIVPPVQDTRGTCSWTNHFRGTDPKIITIDGLHTLSRGVNRPSHHLRERQCSVGVINEPMLWLKVDVA